MRRRHQGEQGALRGIGRTFDGDGDRIGAEDRLRSRGRDRQGKRAHWQNRSRTLPRTENPIGKGTRACARSGIDDRTRLGRRVKMSILRLIGIVGLAVGLTSSLSAAERVDVSQIIGKTEAAAILDEPVKDPSARSGDGADGYY